MNRTALMCRTAAGVCALTGLVHAQFAYISQTRTVSASTGGENNSASAPGFGFFSESVGSQTPSESASASAGQTSRLGNFEITASGGAGAGALNAFSASASSNLDVEFTLDTGYEYVFAADLVLASSPTDARVQLFGPGGEVILDTVDDSSLSQMGSLEAGGYRLLARVGASNSGSPDFPDPGGSFDFTLTLTPTPGASVVLLSGLAFVTRRRRA